MKINICDYAVFIFCYYRTHKHIMFLLYSNMEIISFSIHIGSLLIQKLNHLFSAMDNNLFAAMSIFILITNS